MRTARIVFALLVLGLTLVHGDDSAWWVDVQFTPSDQAIEGIPIRQLDRSWATASPLRESMLPDQALIALIGGDTLKDHNATLQLEGDLNRDGRPDKLLVGVYRTTSGSTGEFLLVLSRNRNGKWKKAGGWSGS